MARPTFSRSPGCTARSPGFFVLHGPPGSNPGWRTKTCCIDLASPAPAQRPDQRGLLFYNLNVASVFHSCSRRLTARIAGLQPADAGSSPAGNATDRGRSSVARAPALQAGKRRLDSDRLHQSTRCGAARERASFGTRRARRRLEQGPHSWGCDRKGVHRPAA